MKIESFGRRVGACAVIITYIREQGRQKGAGKRITLGPRGPGDF